MRHLIRSIFSGFIFGSAYYCFYKVNFWLFSVFGFNRYVTLIYLPAGIRLLAVLIGKFSGAVGVAIATFVIECSSPSVTRSFPIPYLHELSIAFVSGFFPYYVILFLEQVRSLDRELLGFTAKEMTRVCFLVAGVTSLGHQVLFSFLQIPSSFFLWVQMAVGDILGSFICLLLARQIVIIHANRFPKSL